MEVNATFDSIGNLTDLIMGDVENPDEDKEPQSATHNRQIQVRIIQIAPRTRGLHSQPFFPDPADLLLEDGATATANIIRSATSLPTTVHTREIRLNQASNSAHPRSASGSQQLHLDDIPEHSEVPHEQSTCRCHVMRMADNTILWFVVNDVEPENRQTANSSHPGPTADTQSSVRASDSGPFCRICFLGSEDGPLLRVCHCRGTVGMVHHRCVLTWTMQRQSYSCEICHYAYNLQVNGLRWCWRWVYPVPGGQIATQCLLFTMSWIVMVFSIASLVFISFNLRTLFPDEITAGVFIIMNSFTLLCSIGILLTQSMYPIRSICQRFCLANLELEILPFNETEETAQQLAAQPQSQCPTPTSTVPDSLPYSISSPNLSFVPISNDNRLMSIPSVQLNELVRSNQAVLGSLRDSGDAVDNQTRTTDNQVVTTPTRRRRCCIN